MVVAKLSSSRRGVLILIFLFGGYCGVSIAAQSLVHHGIVGFRGTGLSIRAGVIALSADSSSVLPDRFINLNVAGKPKIEEAYSENTSAAGVSISPRTTSIVAQNASSPGPTQARLPGRPDTNVTGYVLSISGNIISVKNKFGITTVTLTGDTTISDRPEGCRSVDCQASMHLSELSLGDQVWVSGSGRVGSTLAGVKLLRQRRFGTRTDGTVKTISGNTFTIATSFGQSIQVTVVDGSDISIQKSMGARMTATLGDISVGDTIYATGKAGSLPDTVSASSVLVSKAFNSGESAKAGAQPPATAPVAGTHPVQVFSSRIGTVGQIMSGSTLEESTLEMRGDDCQFFFVRVTKAWKLVDGRAGASKTTRPSLHEDDRIKIIGEIVGGRDLTAGEVIILGTSPPHYSIGGCTPRSEPIKTYPVPEIVLESAAAIGYTNPSPSMTKGHGSTALDEEAAEQAKAFLARKFTKCGDDYYSGTQTSESFFVSQSYTEIKGLRFFEPVRDGAKLSAADRLNDIESGVEWRGGILISESVTRSRYVNDRIWGDWGKWSDSSDTPFVYRTMTKKKGKWYIEGPGGSWDEVVDIPAQDMHSYCSVIIGSN